MEAKENRPDACTASGTAKSIYKYSSTDVPDIQEEKGWLCLPEDCVDMVAVCEEQSIAYDNLLAYAALSYLQGIDAENPPFRDTLKFELLTLTNRCIDAYNLGKRDPNAPAGAKRKDAYPDEKQGAERYKRLSGLHFLQIAIVLRELHHAIGFPVKFRERLLQFRRISDGRMPQMCVGGVLLHFLLRPALQRFKSGGFILR